MIKRSLVVLGFVVGIFSISTIPVFAQTVEEYFDEAVVRINLDYEIIDQALAFVESDDYDSELAILYDNYSEFETSRGIYEYGLFVFESDLDDSSKEVLELARDASLAMTEGVDLLMTQDETLSEDELVSTWGNGVDRLDAGYEIYTGSLATAINSSIDDYLFERNLYIVGIVVGLLIIIIAQVLLYKTKDEGRKVLQEEIRTGGLWVLGGSLITYVTYEFMSGTYFVVWGPMLWGLYASIKGTFSLVRYKPQTKVDDTLSAVDLVVPDELSTPIQPE